MRVFIELPTWLGDAVMASAAIENLSKNAKNIVFFGSYVACALYKSHPKCEKVVIDDSKKQSSRYLSLIKTARKLGKFDIAISFRSSFASKFLLFFLKATQKFCFKKSSESLHQVQKYLNFIKQCLNLKEISNELKIYYEVKKSEQKLLVLNPGASYGSAKRWYPHYFAEVALHFKDEFDVKITGSKAELEICNEIEQILLQNGMKCENLAGKTSIKELCELIGSIKNGIFLTNDSGPMHIAAAYKVPLVALFGPTKFKETSPWKDESAKIVHLNLECMPCMKRVCPIKTHACMKDLTPKMVITEIELLRKKLNF
ncbi:lipopolysaccharide heptosyltransferase II [Campylobacter concisus]